MKSLAELNANQTPRKWSEYTVVNGYAVGGMGRSWSRFHKGAKFHLIHTTTIVSVDMTDEEIAAKRAAFPAWRPAKVGSLISHMADCNGNGSYTGIIAPGYDTDAINCKNCLGNH